MLSRYVAIIISATATISAFADTLPSPDTKHGTNALDAISSLNRFRSSINDTRLLTSDGSDLFVLINGVPATAADLRAYHGCDIDSIAYYPVAPSQYAMYTSGAMIDVKIRKPVGKSYSGYINTVNAVNTGCGNNLLGASYSDATDRLSVDYTMSYRNIGRLDCQSTFSYPTETDAYSDNGHLSQSHHRATAAYLHRSDNHLLSAKLSYTANPLSLRTDGSGTITERTASYTGSDESYQRSRSNATVLDLFYHRALTNDRTLTINLINTFGNAYSDACHSLSFDKAHWTMEYDVASAFNDRSYALTANVVYSSPLWNGRLHASSSYEFARLSRTLSSEAGGTLFSPYYHNERLNAGITWTRFGMTLSPAVGLNLRYHNERIVGQSHISATPFVRFDADHSNTYNPNGLKAHLTLRLQYLQPTLTDLAESYIYLDQWTMSMGNADLRSYFSTDAALNIAYYGSNGCNKVALTIRPQYNHNSSPYIITDRDGYTIIQRQPISDNFYNFTALTGSWFPFRWLELTPYVELHTYRYHTPSTVVHDNYGRIGGIVALTFQPLSVIVSATSPTRSYNGDIYRHEGARYNAQIQYRHRKWSIGLIYGYVSHHNYITASATDFSYRYSCDRSTLRQVIGVTATYTL